MAIKTIRELIEALKKYPAEYQPRLEVGDEFDLEIERIELGRWKLLSDGKDTEYRFFTDKAKAENAGHEEELLDVPPPHTWVLENVPKVILFG